MKFVPRQSNVTILLPAFAFLVCQLAILALYTAVHKESIFPSPQFPSCKTTLIQLLINSKNYYKTQIYYSKK